MVRSNRVSRNGISTLWVILGIPLFLTLLLFTVDIANLWLAQIELENGLEAAALAAAKHWGKHTELNSTLPAREAGLAYARLNRVRCQPIVLSTNHDPAASLDSNNPNENLDCCATATPSGNLIFGMISDDDPLTFDAGKQPGCGIGTVLFDATASGNLGGNDKTGNAISNAWGISFQAAQGTPENLTIARVIIDVRGTTGNGTFDFTSSAPVVSTSVDPPATSGIIPCQADVKGFTNPSQQIQFDYTGTTPQTLTIHFRPDPPADPGAGSLDKGFEPGDRFRFGAKVSQVGGPQGNIMDDGDGVGEAPVIVTVIFALNGIEQPPVYATFVNTSNKQSDCNDTCPVHPTGIPDLPCPATSSQTNDGQSYVMLNGSGNNDFGVRAQAIMPVKSLSRKIFGNCFGPLYVTAKVTARYNCSLGRAWLVEVEKFICPGPETP